MMPQLQPSKKQPCCRGNTLVEYALIGVAVIGLSVLVLMNLGGRLNEVLQGNKSQAQTQIEAAAQWNQYQAQQASTVNNMQSSIGNALIESSQNGGIIQVTAANGSTQIGLFGNTQGYATSNIPPQQMTPADIQALMRDMSNRTYLISGLVGQMNSILQYTGNDPSKFISTELYYNGQTQPAMAAATALAYEATVLQNMLDQLSASKASAQDISKMQALVASVKDSSNTIYLQASALQKKYDQEQAALAKAAQAAGVITGESVAASADVMCQTGKGNSINKKCLPAFPLSTNENAQ